MATETRTLSTSWSTAAWAPMITHTSLLVLTAAMFLLVFFAPWYVMVVPGVLLHHRIGILVHEYIHGIPFRKYKHNHWVVTIFDGVFMSLGFFELFRSTHLIHHKHLNGPEDPARQTALREGPRNRILYFFWVTEAFQHLIYLGDAIKGHNSFIKISHFFVAFVLSVVHMGFWIYIGRADVVLSIVVLAFFTTLVSSSLRGAIEHHSTPDDDAHTNEYRTFLPLFNMNRHVHHHQEPTLAWYRLEYKTDRILPARAFVSHWYHVYIKKDFVMMPPEKKGSSRKKTQNEATTLDPAEAVETSAAEQHV